MKLQTIKDIEQLKELAGDADSRPDFYIALNAGALSGKQIIWDEGTFYIENEIDGSEQVLSEEEVFDSRLTLIGEALKKGALKYHRFEENPE